MDSQKWTPFGAGFVPTQRLTVNQRSHKLEEKSMLRFIRSVALAGMIATGGLSIAQAQQHAPQQGGIPVRIDGAPDSACINTSTDKVYLTLYRVIETKKDSFFAHENQAEIVVTVKVQADPEPSQPLSFPLSTKVNTRPYKSGQISLPVEYNLVGLKLQQNTGGTAVTYTGFSIDTTLVNVKSKAGLASAIDALSSVTGSNKLPIPSSPYTQAATYLLGFASTAIQNDIDATNKDDKLSTATLSMIFSSDSSCGKGFEKTGTKAILMATGDNGDPGYVPINQTDQYCWTADVTPSFVLKAAKAVTGKVCGDASYNSLYKEVSNDYLAFFLLKQTTAPGHLSGGPNRILSNDIRDAKTLCRLLGVEAACPAATLH
jgi:hypothetical protein